MTIFIIECTRVTFTDNMHRGLTVQDTGARSASRLKRPDAGLVGPRWYNETPGASGFSAAPVK